MSIDTARPLLIFCPVLDCPALYHVQTHAHVAPMAPLEPLTWEGDQA